MKGSIGVLSNLFQNLWPGLHKDKALACFESDEVHVIHKHGKRIGCHAAYLITTGEGFKNCSPHGLVDFVRVVGLVIARLVLLLD